MAYTQQTWANDAVGGTLLSADRLTHMEVGIEDVDTRLATVEGTGAVAANKYLPAPSGDVTGVTDANAINTVLNAAAAAGGGRVIAKSGVTYQVSSTGTQTVQHPSGGTATRNRAVVIPDNVTLDMNTSTLQLRGSAECWILCNSNTSGTGTRSHDVGILNAVIDTNGVVFSTYANVHLSHIDRLTMRQVKIINGRYFGVWCYNVVESTFDNLDADTFTGNSWQFGDPQAGGNGLNQVYRSSFGRLRAKNISLLNTGSQPGNPYTFCVTECTIDSLWAYNCGGGIKVYAPSQNVAVGYVVLNTIGESTALNSGFKIQGDNTSGRINRVNVGQVVSINQANMGLAMLFTQDCSVGAYIGYNNVLLHNANSDVLIGGGTNDFVGSVNSVNSNGGGVRVSSAPGVTGDPTGYRIDSVRVTNCGRGASAAIKSAVRADVLSNGSFGPIYAVDNQATPTMSRGFDATVSTAVGTIDRLSSTGQTDVVFNSTGGGFVQPAGLLVKEGTNAKMGVTAAMTAGAITVANTSVTATSRIFLTAQTTGGTPGALRVSARTAGTSFTITSTSTTDTSTVAWLIAENG